MDAKAQREGASNSKRLTVTMEVDTLECPICFEPLRPPIFQCSVGHFICSPCRGKHLHNKCHICSAKTTFKRCFGMEHVVQTVKVSCSNAMYGCTKKVTYYQKEEHEKACTDWGCFCPKPFCTFLGPTEALLDHLTTEHEFPSSTLPDSDTVSLYLEWGFYVLQRRQTDYFFLLRLLPSGDGHALSIICVQPSTMEPNKLTCNMSFDCFATGFRESLSCPIRSSSLSGGFLPEYELIMPKGKISEDRHSMMLRITIQQALSVSRPILQRKGPTPAPQSSEIVIRGSLGFALTHKMLRD
ncbi:E3 ubiquitin-protein ligase SINA-like 10 [Lolium rigidum]|uniref:E3 ubiquitin-protein ligase SINA-like 10 n=1 Tax=Lolium rigidum TaxID=89674 RepID=UPI001F5C951A|nr:E3 ubiquitin-protein ligase SINA-like 10 [Lolium rigidum]XP_047088350.1 E3 ubiquitin-protein ligase SINA-like 10 [Lolium rigidum]XP_047088351.1 E3 ubiquitin-protein ligase SINA-like 10 [Lolium rigidum]XP_047088352.1 E3 ubiquitin-protein ligase SINA-like 10 [Lolium rigidum]